MCIKGAMDGRGSHNGGVEAQDGAVKAHNGAVAARMPVVGSAQSARIRNAVYTTAKQGTITANKNTWTA
jgi:hypothetical protein